MNFYVVEDGELVSYLRTGACTRCGDCCQKKITFEWQVWRSEQEGMKDGGDEEGGEPWSSYEGYSVILRHGVWWAFLITGIEGVYVCPHWGGGGGCTIWEDQVKRPVLCPFWPVHPKDLEKFPRCGYTFTKLEEKE